jgi:hypothetical protein
MSGSVDICDVSVMELCLISITDTNIIPLMSRQFPIVFVIDA